MQTLPPARSAPRGGRRRLSPRPRYAPTEPSPRSSPKGRGGREPSPQPRILLTLSLGDALRAPAGAEGRVRVFAAKLATSLQRALTPARYAPRGGGRRLSPHPLHAQWARGPECPHPGRIALTILTRSIRNPPQSPPWEGRVESAKIITVSLQMNRISSSINHGNSL